MDWRVVIDRWQRSGTASGSGKVGLNQKSIIKLPRITRSKISQSPMLYSFGSIVVLIVPLACSNLYWFRSMPDSVGTFSTTVITSPGCSGLR